MLSAVRITAVVAGALTTLVAGVVTGVAPADAQDHDHDRSVSVLTFNIHAGIGPDARLDLEGVADEIRRSGADVVGLQEVDRHWGPRSDDVDEPAWLAHRLHMFVAFGANLDLDPASPGQPRRQFGTAILSRFPIRESENVLLPNQEGLEQRGLLRARVLVHGRPMDVYTTHLQHNTPSVRAAQASRVVDLVRSRSCPAVLTGDLNATPTEEPARILTAQLPDSWQVGAGDGLTYPAAAPTKRIDYVLHSSDVRALAAQVLPTAVSDHRPVRVQVRLDDGDRRC